MTFEEFVKRLESDVKKFESDYLSGHKSDAEVYPLEMGETEWEEQFLYLFDRDLSL